MKNSLNPENYCSVALTSCFYKTMKSMVNKRLVKLTESNNHITNSQCCFRNQRSIMDHVVRLETSMKRQISKNNISLQFFQPREGICVHLEIWSNEGPTQLTAERQRAQFHQEFSSWTWNSAYKSDQLYQTSIINITKSLNLELMTTYILITSVSPPDLNKCAQQSINCNNFSRKSTNG